MVSGAKEIGISRVAPGSKRILLARLSRRQNTECLGWLSLPRKLVNKEPGKMKLAKLKTTFAIEENSENSLNSALP